MNKRLHKKIHISWFIAWTSLGFLCGVALSIFPMSSMFADIAWVVVGASLIVIATIKRKAPLIPLVLIAGLIFGLWRGAVEQRALTSYQSFYGKNLVINGKITEDTSLGTHGDQRFRLGGIKIDNQKLPEEIWVSTTSSLDIKRGDIVTVKGTMQKGFGNIPASMFRANLLNIKRPYPGDIGRRVRDRWGDIGWYLSFSAFIGVIVLAPLLHHYFWGEDKQPHAFRRLLIETFSAQLATLPIILLAFHQYSKYALLANILVVPLVPFMMALTFFSGIAGLITPGVAGLVGAPATFLLNYSVSIISFIANLPNAKTDITFSPNLLVVSYIFVIFIIGFLMRKTRHSFRKDKIQMS
jgi:predicted membrane metal-binding protein